ncbi:MAG: cyclase/dehydrase [Fibrobacteres bacterium]|nr:cyclase/dehydrase [Fibrobacterota bacterium]
MDGSEMASDGVASEESASASAAALNPVLEFLSRYGKMKINVAEAERWGSAALGSGLLLYGLKRRSWVGALFALAGGGLILRGALGKSLFYRLIGVDSATGQGLMGQDVANDLIRVDKSLVIHLPAEELYRFLRNMENLPRFFSHLQSVRTLDAKRSVWSARMPAGLPLEWETEITEERENRKVAWRAKEGSVLRSEGALVLDPMDGGSRTQVGVHLEYDLPLGKPGKVFARLFGKHPDRLIDEELHRFKSLMEAGD